MMYCTRLIILSAHDARSTLISPQIQILEGKVTKKETIQLKVNINCALETGIEFDSQLRWLHSEINT